MTVDVKICGLSTLETVQAAVNGGARFVGLVFFPPSPRAVTLDQAVALAAAVPPGITRVGLFVDPNDATLATTLARVDLDMIQAHGRESPQRIAAIRAMFGRPVMKALAIGEPGDLITARAYDAVADRLLFDARPPPGATRPGGNAQAFDWTLVSAWTGTTPWMLAGGLTAETVGDAVAASGATAVDVSSGVETSPGVKSLERITAFLERARSL